MNQQVASSRSRSSSSFAISSLNSLCRCRIRSTTSSALPPANGCRPDTAFIQDDAQGPDVVRFVGRASRQRLGWRIAQGAAGDGRVVRRRGQAEVQ